MAEREVSRNRAISIAPFLDRLPSLCLRALIERRIRKNRSSPARKSTEAKRRSVRIPKTGAYLTEKICPVSSPDRLTRCRQLLTSSS